MSEAHGEHTKRCCILLLPNSRLVNYGEKMAKQPTDPRGAANVTPGVDAFRSRDVENIVAARVAGS